MGGALAELEALSLVLRLPSLVNIRTVVFGTPRVGNPAYAKFFDSQVPNFKRINNKRGMRMRFLVELFFFFAHAHSQCLDIVPIVPGRSMGYLHPQGEIHLLGPGFAVSCPGLFSDTELLLPIDLLRRAQVMIMRSTCNAKSSLCQTS